MFGWNMLILASVLVLTGLPAHAADMEMQAVDKNCFIEIFEDDNFDADDPHVVLQGPKDYASLKNIGGKDWANDIESVIVGPMRLYGYTRIRISRGRSWPFCQVNA